MNAHPTPTFFKPWTISLLDYQKIFLKIFEKMDLGKLKIVLPTGESLLWGAATHEPSATIHIRSSQFFKRCVLYGDIGFGEAYTEGEWEADSITEVIRWMILNVSNNPEISGSQASPWRTGWLRWINQWKHFRENHFSGNKKNIAFHYDLSNAFFASFLDETMTYSCADFSQTSCLKQAQIDKWDRMAHLLQLKPGHHVLEIGGGWGGFALHLASEYQCQVTTLTLSEEQFKKIQILVQEANLSDKIKVLLTDYRHLPAKPVFDRVVSIEMIEALGHKHLPRFFKVAHEVLKPEGILGIQVITSADARYDKIRKRVDWIQKHIFPGSLIPSLEALTQAARQYSTFQMHWLYDMGLDYAETLKQWRLRFHEQKHHIETLGFDERLIRSWNYYFSYCEAAFSTRHISAVQIAYTRPNNTKLQPYRYTYERNMI
jgi:cyclopropane-fatty-acyl-phospholipid synthase